METKNNALGGVRSGAFTRILSCILAATLAVTMCPATGIAYAAEGEDNTTTGTTTSAPSSNEGNSANRINEDVQLEKPSDSNTGEEKPSTEDGAGGTGATNASGETNTSPSDEPSEGAGAAQSKQNEPAAQYTGLSNGQISADVSLGSSTTIGTIEYNGLAYTINTDDPTTVSVTGLATTAPKGDVQIPAQVASGSELFTVTKIIAGGGALKAR